MYLYVNLKYIDIEDFDFKYCMGMKLGNFEIIRNFVVLKWNEKNINKM